MILPFHIVIALSSLFFTGYVFLHPSNSKIVISYIFVALTFTSGFFLVINNPSHMVSACVMGIIYLGVVLSGIFAARHRLEQSFEPV